jgi:DNA-binding response OmpR family regulator
MNKTIILLVDDDRGFGESVQEFLQLRGYEARLATDIATAKSLIVQDPPALVIIDVRLVNPEDDFDESGMALAKQLDPQLPKIILTDYPTAKKARETLKPGPDGKSIATDFVSKAEGLHTLLTSVRLALAQLPPTFENHLLKAFRAPALLAIREQLTELGVRDAVQYLKTAETKTLEELLPQRAAAQQQAAHLHKFRLAANIVALALLTTAIAMWLFGLTNEGLVFAVISAFAEAFDLLMGKQEKQSYRRAEKLRDELRRTKQGDHWLLMCEAFEDPPTRDEYRKKVLEHILSQRFD